MQNKKHSFDRLLYVFLNKFVKKSRDVNLISVFFKFALNLTPTTNYCLLLYCPILLFYLLLDFYFMADMFSCFYFIVDVFNCLWIIIVLFLASLLFYQFFALFNLNWIKLLFRYIHFLFNRFFYIEFGLDQFFGLLNFINLIDLFMSLLVCIYITHNR